MRAVAVAGGRARAGAVVVAAAVALAFADSSIVMLGLPEIYGEFDASISGVSWVITAYNLVVALSALALAPVIGRVRPTPVAALGLVLFAGSSLACGLVADLTALVALRGVQGLGSALLLAASLPILAALVGSVSLGRIWWGTAGTLGAVLGPVAGGLATELFDWRAIFLAQAPVAALALVGLADSRVRMLAAEGSPRDARARLWPNCGLMLAFGALVGALFLAVLMMVTVWGLGPLAGAMVVSVLPVAAIAVAPLSRRSGHRASAASGALLLALGLAALALLPAAGTGWAVAALLVCGAGFGLLVPPLTAASIAGESGSAAAALSVGARHVGLVAALLIVAPLLSADLADGADRATLNATRAILDAPIGLTQKVPIALAIADEFERTPRGAVPDVAAAFDANGAGEDAQVAMVRDGLVETIESALTAGFRSAYLASALFALVALVPIAWGWGRARDVPRAPPAWLANGMLVGLVVVAGGLLVVEARAGGTDLGRSTASDPCLAEPREGGGGIDATLQGVVLDGLAGAACELRVSRESLVLSFGSDLAAERVPWSPAVVERAVRSGLVRAINDAQERGSLNSLVADVARALARRAPIDELIRGAVAVRDLAGRAGEIDAGGLVDRLRDALP